MTFPLCLQYSNRPHEKKTNKRSASIVRGSHKRVVDERRVETRRSKKRFMKRRAEFDRLVESEKTADSINDFFMETVKEAVRPLLARRPRNEEEWVIRSPAEVTTLLKQRRDEMEKAHTEGGRDREFERNYSLERGPTEKIRRLSVTLSLANKRLENDRKKF